MTPLVFLALSPMTLLQEAPLLSLFLAQDAHRPIDLPLVPHHFGSSGNWLWLPFNPKPGELLLQDAGVQAVFLTGGAELVLCLPRRNSAGQCSLSTKGPAQATGHGATLYHPGLLLSVFIVLHDWHSLKFPPWSNTLGTAPLSTPRVGTK